MDQLADAFRGRPAAELSVSLTKAERTAKPVEPSLAVTPAGAHAAALGALHPVLSESGDSNAPVRFPPSSTRLQRVGSQQAASRDGSREESEIRDIALGLAADQGDQAPALIQHVACTRAEANRAMCGAVVPGDRTSWLIAIQGQFTARRHLRRRFQPADAEVQQFSVIMLVVDAANGAPTDSGHSNDYPELAAVGPVTTDYIAVDA
jgi:hypothetical protein